MKKINKKGFALAEAIVVSVFVLGMFTYLAMNIIPLISKYDAVLKYDNPQEIYAANVLYDEVLSYIYSNSGNDYSIDVSDNTDFSSMQFNKETKYIKIDGKENQNYFSELIDYLGIVNTFLLDDKRSGINDDYSTNYNKCSGINNDYSTNYRGMRDYCNYLFSKKGLGNKKDYAIFLVEFENNKFSHFVIMDGGNK